MRGWLERMLKQTRSWEKLHLAAGQWSQTQGQSNTEVIKNRKVNVLHWPSQSPDLNLFENLLHCVKITVNKQHPTNLTNLEKIWQEEWVKMYWFTINILAGTICVSVICYPEESDDF